MLKEFSGQETQEKEKTYNNKTKTTKKMIIGTCILIKSTLKVNGLNASIKRHRLAERIQNKTHICAAYKRKLQTKDTYRLKVRG